MSKSKPLVNLTTTTAVIDAIGDGMPDKSTTQVVADILGLNYNAVFNWHAQHTFPSRTYVVLRRLLAAKGFCAPDSLWGMTEEARVA
jgi:hypothetical protein